jgi:hypothetical protein
LETADRTRPTELQSKTEHIHDKLKALREQMQRMDHMSEQLSRIPEGQLSLSDPDARSMISQAKGSGLVGYNVQTAVDTKHHLVVAHAVINVGIDRGQLSAMALSALEAMSKKRLRALADRGYYNGPQIKACADAGITPLVPKPMTSNPEAQGRIGKDDFIDLGRALGVAVVAEGIEEAEQWHLLKRMGCSHGQGYLFSPPLSAWALAEWLERWPYGRSKPDSSKQ